MGDASGWDSACNPVLSSAHAGTQQSLKERKESVHGGETLLRLVGREGSTPSSPRDSETAKASGLCIPT